MGGSSISVHSPKEIKHLNKIRRKSFIPGDAVRKTLPPYILSDSDLRSTTGIVVAVVDGKEIYVLWSNPIQQRVIKFPSIKRVFPSLIAHDIVQIQPMSLPSGSIFYTNYVYSQPAKIKVDP